MTEACERLFSHAAKIADSKPPQHVGRCSVRVSDMLYDEVIIAGFEHQLGNGRYLKTVTHLRGIELIHDPNLPAGSYKMREP